MTGNGNLYRYPREGKIAGVCAGLAHYFGIEVWLVRIMVITVFLFGGAGIVILAYLAAWLFMDKYSGEWVAEEEPALKSKTWQAGESAHRRVQTLAHEFTELETQLRRLEGYVTSETFKVRNKFRQL
ncbi:MAG: envelope stress response membrane protein PspC [Plesiomonas sp.]